MEWSSVELEVVFSEVVLRVVVIVVASAVAFVGVVMLSVTVTVQHSRPAVNNKRCLLL